MKEIYTYAGARISNDGLGEALDVLYVSNGRDIEILKAIDSFTGNKGNLDKVLKSSAYKPAGISAFFEYKGAYAVKEMYMYATNTGLARITDDGMGEALDVLYRRNKEEIGIIEYIDSFTGKKGNLDKVLESSLGSGLDAVKKLYAYATDGTGPARISPECITKAVKEAARCDIDVDVLEYLDNLSGKQVDLKPSITKASEYAKIERIKKLYDYITRKNRMSSEDFAVAVFDGMTNNNGWVSEDEKLAILKFLCEETPALHEMVRNGTTDELYSKLGEQDGELKKYLDEQSYKAYTDNSKKLGR